MARPLPFTAAELREGQLFGIPMQVVDEFGTVHTYPDRVIEQRITAAVNTFERRLKIDLAPRRILCRPAATSPAAVLGQDYDVEEDPMDYEAPFFYANGYIQLRRRPILSVEKLELRFPEADRLFIYPQEWLRINHRSGQINVLAIAGASSPLIIGREGGYLPLLTGQLLRASFPQLIYCDYTAGLDFLNPAHQDDYGDLFLALQQQAAVNVLLELGRGRKPGVSSESISEDGQSESTSYVRGQRGLYGPEITELTEQVEKFLTSFKADKKGPLFVVL